MEASFVSGTSPMNSSVTCRFSGRTQRDEQTHGRSGPFGAARRRLPAVVKKMDAYEVQRQLRGMPADGLAISRKDHAALLDAAGMRQRDVHGTDWLFLAAAARTGNARDAHAQRTANLASNAFGQRDGHFAADRAFRLRSEEHT